jgi:hypothetical protein
LFVQHLSIDIANSNDLDLYLKSSLSMSVIDGAYVWRCSALSGEQKTRSGRNSPELISFSADSAREIP